MIFCNKIDFDFVPGKKLGYIIKSRFAFCFGRNNNLVEKTFKYFLFCKESFYWLSRYEMLSIKSHFLQFLFYIYNAVIKDLDRKTECEKVEKAQNGHTHKEKNTRAQFHQRSTYEFFVPTYISAAFSTYVQLEKSAKMTFIWKTRTFYVDEIDTRGHHRISLSIYLVWFVFKVKCGS